MNNSERLEQLKTLRIKRSDGSVFESANACMEWIDNVAPLLKYDEDHYTTFTNHAQVVRVTNLSADLLMTHLNPMIGTVNQAILELEKGIGAINPKAKEALMPPNKVTMQWLWMHVPWKYWFYFFGLLTTAFISGMSFSDSALYQNYIKPLISNNTQ